MQPFDPFRSDVTADEIRNFLRFEFPYVPEPAPDTRKRGLQELAKKWIDLHAQAEASKCDVGDSEDHTDTKPILKKAVGTKYTDIENKPKKIGSTHIQKPRPSKSSSSQDVSTSLLPSGSAVETSSLGNAVKSKSLQKAARTSSNTKKIKDIAKPHRGKSPYKKYQPEIKIKQEPASPRSTSMQKKQPVTQNSVTRKDHRMVPSQPTLILSPAITDSPEPPVKRMGVSRSTQPAPRHKRDVEVAFAETPKSSNDPSQKENIKKPKAVPTPVIKKSRAATAARKTLISPKSKPSKSPLPAQGTSTLKRSPNPDRHVHLASSDPVLGSDSSSLTPLDSTESSSDIEVYGENLGNRQRLSSCKAKSTHSASSSDSTTIANPPRKTMAKNVKELKTAEGSNQPHSDQTGGLSDYEQKQKSAIESAESYKCDCRKEVAELRSRVEYLEVALL